MATTTAISRNSRLLLHRALRHFSSSSSSSHQWQRPSKSTFHLLHHQIPPPRPPLPLPQSDKFVGDYCGMRSFSMFQRFLCTTTSGSNEAKKPDSTEAPKGSSEGGDSGSNEESGGSNRSSEQGRAVRGGPVSWLSFLLLVASGLGVVTYYKIQRDKIIEVTKDNANAIKQGPSAGKAAIGGPFNLVNHDGKAVTEKDFMGKWTVIYFGFTHCPDICPDELQKLAAAVDKIKGKAGIEIVPVFISVDPERDTVEQVGEYVKEFHPNLIGLTGDADEIRKVARAYRVYYMKTEEEGSDYLVDHSIIMYLMDPNMDFVKFFGKNNDVDALSEGIIKEVKEYKKVQKSWFSALFS